MFNEVRDTAICHNDDYLSQVQTRHAVCLSFRHEQLAERRTNRNYIVLESIELVAEEGSHSTDLDFRTQ